MLVVSVVCLCLLVVLVLGCCLWLGKWFHRRQNRSRILRPTNRDKIKLRHLITVRFSHT